MSTRRTILRELNSRHENGNGGYTRPGSISGFDRQPAVFQAAVNALLQERLINGTKDNEGRLAIALNTQRMSDIQKELRPWFGRPAIWFALIVLAGAAAGALVVFR